MRGKALRKPARPARRLASANQAVRICIDYGRHLVNTIKQSTVTECPFLPLIYFSGYFQAMVISVFLMRLNEHHVKKFGEDRSSTF